MGFGNKVAFNISENSIGTPFLLFNVKVDGTNLVGATLLLKPLKIEW
jgi:hypothetical protein